MAIPSILQIAHELRVFTQDDARVRCAAEEGLPVSASWDEIVARRAVVAQGLSI